MANERDVCEIETSTPVSPFARKSTLNLAPRTVTTEAAGRPPKQKTAQRIESNRIRQRNKREAKRRGKHEGNQQPTANQEFPHMAHEDFEVGYVDEYSSYINEIVSRAQKEDFIRVFLDADVTEQMLKEMVIIILFKEIRTKIFERASYARSVLFDKLVDCDNIRARVTTMINTNRYTNGMHSTENWREVLGQTFRELIEMDSCLSQTNLELYKLEQEFYEIANIHAGMDIPERLLFGPLDKS